MKKGGIPWNKGKKWSEEIKRKFSIAHKGKKLSEEHKRKLSEKNKNVIHTKEWNKKVSEALKGRKGPKQTEETKRKKAESLRGKKRSEEYKQQMSFSRLGELNPNWRGGRIRGHSGSRYKRWQIKVFERDNWTCQNCGIRGIKLNAHHIKSWENYKELRYELNNGVSLCIECHKLCHKFRSKKNEKKN